MQKDNIKYIEAKSRANNKMGLLAMAILALGFILISLFLWMGKILPWMKYLYYAVLVDFFFAVILVIMMSLIKKKGKMCSALNKMAICNVLLFWIVIQLVFPSMLIMFGLVFVRESQPFGAIHQNWLFTIGK